MVGVLASLMCAFAHGEAQVVIVNQFNHRQLVTVCWMSSTLCAHAPAVTYTYKDYSCVRISTSGRGC